MAGVGHLAAIPVILIRHTQMVPYVPEKFCFADVAPSRNSGHRCEAHASGVLETRRSRVARDVLSAFHSVWEL
jgi:hypothetical protein